MSSRLKVFCPECKYEIETSYIMLGAEAICPNCKQSIRLKEFLGMSFPNTGYEIDFSGFQGLLKVESYRPKFKKFLIQHLQLDVRQLSEEFVVCSANGETVNLLELHLKIQRDSVLQLTLYRLAMSLWR